MRGQDDLKYTTYSDKRPDFAGQENKIQSSGNYTWFFTFRPRQGASKVDADVLACHNRVVEDDRQVPPADFQPSSTGGTFTLDSGLVELLTQTKYVFVTWENTNEEGKPVIDGTWCKIVFLDKSNPARPRIVVTGDLQGIGNGIRVYFPSGVLYHKRLEDVPVE